MSIEIISLIIGIIGGVTGVCALLFELYKAIVGHPKMKIKSYIPYLNGFYNNTDPFFPDSKILVVFLQITNKNSNPIGINNITVRHNGKVSIHNEKYSLNSLYIPHGDGYFDHYAFASKLSYPALINPMGIIETTLIYPKADDLYDEYKKNIEEPLKIKLTIDTTNGRKKHHIFAFELTKENIKKCKDAHKRNLRNM